MLRASITAFILFLCASVATAQSGKISAKVVDARTGEVLVRATVSIDQTKQGAYTKDNGIATIINVSPAQGLSVTVKYGDYKPQTIANVRVQSGITTELEFKLSNKEQEVIEVTAQALVEKSNTKQGKNFENSEIINVPGRQNIDAIVQLTPGIVVDASNGGISVNGSRGTSNSIRFQNIELTDAVSGRTNSLQSNVSKFAVSELNITTSGADASVGGTSGGAINTTTKAGGNEMELQMHYRQEIPALFGTSGNGYEQMAQNDYIYELAVGGPLFTNDVKYFITAKANTREFDNTTPNQFQFGESNSGLDVRDPWGFNLGQLPHSKFIGRAVTAKFSFDAFGFGATIDGAYSASTQQYNNRSFRYGDPLQLPAQNNIEQLYSLTGKGQIGEGILEFSAGLNLVSDRYGKYDQSAGGGLFSLYRIVDPVDEYTYDDITATVTKVPDGIFDIYTPVSKQIPDPRNPANAVTLDGAGVNPFTGRVEGAPQFYTTNNPYGLLNAFFSAGNSTGFSYDTRERLQIDAKYGIQLDEHYLRFGFEGQLHHIYSYSNSLPWDANPFKDSFDVRPFLGAIYLIDKMEFSDITFNPSLRFDFYNPGNDRSLTNPEDPLGSENFSFESAPMQTQLSPRLGITYAVSEQTTFNFNYNLYYKQPLFGEVLTNTGGDFRKVLQRGNQIIGNGALKGERTTEIVVGFTTALNEVLRMDVQGVYKDMRNLSGLQRISSEFLPTGYTLYSDDQYGNSKSIQLSFEKRMRDNYALRFNYTFSSSKGTSSSATENYGRLISSSASPDGDVAVLPLQPFALSFDRPHIAQLILSFGWQKDQGPKLFGASILELFNLSMTTEFKSGRPYTRLDIRGNQAGEFNADRHPSFFQTDATLSRSIPLADLFGESMGKTALDVSLEVLNLFNRNEPITVYAQTGQGDDDGQPGTYTGTLVFKNDPTNADGSQLDALGNLLYNPRWDLNNDNQVSLAEQQQAYTQLRKDGFARRTNYQIPRRVYLNLSLRF